MCSIDCGKVCNPNKGNWYLPISNGIKLLQPSYCVPSGRLRVPSKQSSRQTSPGTKLQTAGRALFGSGYCVRLRRCLPAYPRSGNLALLNVYFIVLLRLQHNETLLCSIYHPRTLRVKSVCEFRHFIAAADKTIGPVRERTADSEI